MKQPTDIIFLKHMLSHLGGHSGYENFIPQLKAENIRYTEVQRLRSLQRFDLNRRFYINRSNRKKAGRIGAYYNVFSYLAEMETLQALASSKAKLVHNTFMEDNHGYLGGYKKKHSFALLATAHQPHAWWKYMHKNTAILQQLDCLFALNAESANYFETLMPRRVRLVHHAVDTDFFTASEPIAKRELRILFVGSWMRDLAMLAAVVTKLLQQMPELLVDIVYPPDPNLNNPVFSIAKFPQVTLHYRIPDEALRDLYNRSRFLFLPFIDCTANNALLEAAACGVPILSNDLPGVREYTNPSFAYYFKTETDCVDHILSEIKNDAVLAERSVHARAFMQEHFSLQKIAAAHATVYREFL